jgi:hypothetical protein
MKNCLTLLIVLLVLSNAVHAQMQLKLSNDFDQQYLNISSQNLESNLQLKLPEFSAPAPDKAEFVKGLLLLGILADVSIPMGSEDGFKHIAGTGFSGHVMLNYFISHQFMLALRAGYINFGTQTEEVVDEFGNFKYEDTYSQIPFLFGAYYVFAKKGSTIIPYLGAALGVFIQNYSYNWTSSFTVGGQTYTDTFEGDASSTGFGVVPGVGIYALLGSIILQASVEYAYIFSELPAEEEEDYTYTLEKTSLSLGTLAEDGSSDEKASYFSINVGVSFPIGGK